MKDRNPIKQQLHEEAYRFNFFKAVHLLELFAGGRTPGQGLSPHHDPVHFSVKPGFAFPASDIQSISTNGNGNGNGNAPSMSVNFMGLIGPKGVLPDWYNAYALSRHARKDECFSDFLDLFHQRLLSLFYRAWKKYRLVENYRPDGGDPISKSLSCLAGYSESEKSVDPEFYDYAHHRLLYFCGLVARTVPTVSAIETIVAHAVGAPVRVEQFVERLIPVHAQDRSRLGRKNCTLKTDALCGRTVRDISSFFRVHIGPLSWEHYLAFAPRSHNLKMVRRLITHLAGLEYEFDIRLIVPGHEVPALKIGSKTKAPRLGRTATLRRTNRPCPGDIVITTHDSAPARPIRSGKAS